MFKLKTIALIKQNTTLIIWLLLVCILCNSRALHAQTVKYDVVAINGKYAFAYGVIPDQLVSLDVSANAGASFVWESSIEPINGFVPIAEATNANLQFSTGLTQTMFYRRLATIAGKVEISNTVKIELVSIDWEDHNYVRSHSVLVPSKTTWQQVDALPIGEKLVSTTYMDGLGRPIQKVSREVATPASAGGAWGDVVQYSLYDAFGRSPKQFLPYTTTTNAGKYKTNTTTEQPAYYTGKHNDGYPFSQATYDGSPLNRVVNMKMPGQAWATSAGNSAQLLLNTTADDVQQFTIGYLTTDKPVKAGLYTANTLLKSISTDEQGLQVIGFTNGLGQLVLKKVQLTAAADNGTGSGHNGWICTYYVYDDFGQLRTEIPAEAVKWLEPNGWNFAAANGQTVFDEQCFVYQYDEKGRTTSKKSPGVQPLYMLYDSRDRVVFMQDGNQRLKSPAEWTVNLYDELDRLVLTTLYRSTETPTQLQTLINNAANSSTATITNPGGPLEELEVNSWVAGTPKYAATKNVTVTDGFESGGNADFTIENDPATTSGTITTTTTTHKNPLTAAQLAGANCTVLKYLYYDDYTHATAKAFDQPAATAAATAASAGHTAQPIVKTGRTTGMPTGSLTRVLGSAQFLSSTVYYDEDGQPIQSIDQNITLAYDVATSQYGWDGRLLATHTRHSMPGSALNGYAIKTKYNFDKIGRVTSTDKTFGSNAPRTIASYAYDDMGRLKTKVLDPNYIHPVAGMGPSSGGLESIDYSYNIHGSLVGMNKDYALKAPGYDKWRHFFGNFMAYDKNEGQVTGTRLNGQMAGQVWNTMGDDNLRKFDYTYDNAGRLSKALFYDKAVGSSVWNNTQLDFSTSSYTGKIEYDLNGNILAMTQRGVIMGNTVAQTIDDLRYTYSSFSNKLLKVQDLTTLSTTQNGVNGDYKDGNNGGTATDFVYDDNGNLIADLNKDIKNLAGAAGIRYNHLDKPEEIKIEGKGTIKITYDADGSKLRRQFISSTSTATKTTTYLGEYVYEQTHTDAEAVLQFISFEEGRIRPVTPRSDDNGLDAFALAGNLTLPSNGVVGQQGAIDYFITDQRHDTRMILTEETQWSRATASMETANGRGAIEEGMFGAATAATRVSKSTAPGWTSNTTGFISRLNSSQKTGPHQLLKVMSGDQISTTVQYYYQNAVVNPGGSNVFNDVLNLLGNAILGAPGTATTVKNASTAITGNLNTGTAFSQIIAPDITSATGNRPKAYLNIVFFDSLSRKE